MSDSVHSVYDLQQIEIFARQILGKKTFENMSTLWREKQGVQPNSFTKQPLRLCIVNDGACLGGSPTMGSPVKCVKLCKRIILPDYPINTITGSKKSRITHRFCLVLLVEYENGEFKVITLPRQLSALGSYHEGTTMVFSEIINPVTKVPVPQCMHSAGPCEKITLVYDDANTLSAFEYRLTFPLDTFEPEINRSELENPALESIILLTHLRYETDVTEPFLAPVGEDSFIWTTAVDFILYEDIMIKLGIDQDIVVQGISEI